MKWTLLEKLSARIAIFGMAIAMCGFAVVDVVIILVYWSAAKP